MQERMTNQSNLNINQSISINQIINFSQNGIISEFDALAYESLQKFNIFPMLHENALKMF